MNNTLPLPAIARALTAHTQMSEDEATEFVRVFFDIITDALAEGEQVRIKGLGVFKPSPAADTCVTFIADSEFAASVNSPFEAFAPIELPEGIDADIFADNKEPDTANQAPISYTQETEIKADTEATTETVTKAKAETEAKEEHAPETATERPTAPTKDTNSDETPAAPPVKTSAGMTDEAPADTPVHAPADTPVDTKVEESIQTAVEYADIKSAGDNAETSTEAHEYAEAHEYEEEEVYILPRRRHPSSNVIIVGIICLISGILIGGVAAYFGHDKLVSIFERGDSKAENITEDSREESPEDDSEITGTTDTDVTADNNTPDAISQHNQSTEQNSGVQTPETTKTPNATPEPVYDKVSQRVFLTTLAGRYYGEKEFWPYIYQANKDHLKHPDRIPPGTTILIPDKSTLPLTGDHNADVLKAKRLGSEIYARYKK